MSIHNPIFYPNVTRIPGSGEGQETRLKPQEKIELKNEFDQSLAKELGKENLISAPLEKEVGIKFSTHALQRLRERQIAFDQDTLARMSDAITKADAKGVQESLVLTDRAALIVSIPNRTVITALDRNQMSGNVFTNIDGAVII